MKHYEIRLHIKPTEIKYLGFKQSTNCFATFLMAKDFLPHLGGMQPGS